MTSQATPPRRLAALRAIVNRRMLVSFLMGFASGLPLLLTIGLLQAWMRDEGVDIGKIGLLALAQLPYTLKFLWAPLLDRFAPPFLGRRRGWMLIFQVLLMAAIFGLGQTNPGLDPGAVGLMALLVSFFSASQDTVIDAYRREDLSDSELGLGSTYYIYGYRLGMLLASGGGLILADRMPYSAVYAIMAGSLLVGLITTLFTPEPKVTEGTPQNFREAVVEPFVEFFKRDGAILLLLFIMIYKMGDWMASSMSTLFYLELGFSKTQIGSITKLFGFWMTIGGAFLGGVVMLRIGINKALWVFGFVQMVSTAGFVVLAKVGASLPLLTAVISFENLGTGCGAAALIAFNGARTNKKFTATQYALLTSIVGVPRSVFSAGTGYAVAALGWPLYFLGCTLIAIPGLLLLSRVAPWQAGTSNDPVPENPNP